MALVTMPGLPLEQATRPVVPEGSAPRQARPDALVPTLVLTLVLAFASFALLMSLVMLVVEPEPIGYLGVSQRQDAETALYLAAFAVILPLALIAGSRVANAIATGPNASVLSPLAGILLSTLAAAVLLARLFDQFSWGGGVRTVLVVVGLWSLAAAAALWRACQPRPWRSLAGIADLTLVIWVAAAVLVLGTLLTVTDLGSLSPLPLVVGAVAIPAIVLFGERRRIPRVPRPWGVAVDLVILALLLLVLPDLVIFSPDDPAPSPLDAYRTGVIQFHQDLLLGPTNQVLGGHPLLVDTASQYGVGSILFLAGWFQLAPIGYGTFGLLDGILSALFFVAGYCLLRAAGCSRLLAGSALAVAVSVLVFNRPYAVGTIVQEGPLRFGLPMALVLAAVVGSRWSAHARAARAVGLAILALSSIWAVEAFAFTVPTFLALVGFQAYLLPAGARMRWLARQGALALAACVCAHVLFAFAMLVATGQLPDWGQYLVFLDAFLGDLGTLTYDFAPWSPALAVGAAYLASAASLVLLVRGRPDIVSRERTTLLALTGITAYGIVFFSYFVDRSASHVLAYVSLPALLAAALWLNLLLRSRESLPRGASAGAVAFALSVTVLLLSVAWSSIGSRFDESALGHALPGGDSPRQALDRLWHFPPIDRRAPEGERLIDLYMPGQRQALVLVKPALANEILIRSGRANRLPLANAVEDSFVTDDRKPHLRDAVAELEPGERLLLDADMRETLGTIRADPTSDVLTRLRDGLSTTPLQAYSLQQIDERFRLRPVYRDGAGFSVVELAVRR
jgi:hypothetical protein